MAGVTSTFVSFMKEGGVYMYPLLTAALIGAAYIIERFISFLLARVNADRVLAEIKRLVKEEGVDAAIDYCKRYRAPLVKVLKAGLEAYKEKGADKTALEEALSRAATEELVFIDRGLPVLAAVASVAPVIGFLGTVSGMIHAFGAVAIAGEVEPTLVASGIKEALLTTAFGLSIAFPTLAFHVFFSSQGNNYAHKMELTSLDLIKFLVEEKP